MKKVRVYGETTVSVWVDVEVEDNAELDDIIDAAYHELDSLTSYCGNGGFDKLCGVSIPNAGVEPSEEIEWAKNGEENIEDIE